MKCFFLEVTWLKTDPPAQGDHTFLGFLLLWTYLVSALFLPQCFFSFLCLKFKSCIPSERVLARVLESSCPYTSDLCPKNPRFSITQHGVVLRAMSKKPGWVYSGSGPFRPFPRSAASRHLRAERAVGLRRCVNPAPAPSAWSLPFVLRAWVVSTQYLVPGLDFSRNSQTWKFHQKCLNGLLKHRLLCPPSRVSMQKN